MSDRGQQLYDIWAKPYGLVDRASRSLRREAIETVDSDGVDVALDIGCGPGSNFQLLAEHLDASARIIGVDYSQQMVARAAAEDVPNTSAVQGDARQLPLANDSVDVTVATMALSAMPNIDTVLSEIRRVLADDGVLIVVDGQPVGPVLETLYGSLVNFQNYDLEAELNDAFDTVEVLQTFDMGMGVMLRATV